MHNWVVIEEAYLNYLRAKEGRIPNSNYGADKFKPFFGVLFEVGDLVYVTQISHAQNRHIRMKQAPDFIKIFVPDSQNPQIKRLVAVVNLNYMFPVPKSQIKNLRYKDIDNYRTFANLSEKGKYIDLLRRELKEINALGIESKAKKVYALKNSFPEDIVSKRCIDFTAMEQYAKNYIAK